MKAVVLPSVGSRVAIEELRDPSPRQGEVLVKVAACGVCHSDLHVAKGDIPFVTPCVLGHEISGVVESLGAGVSGIRRGERVVASFIMPCGSCAPCQRGRDDLCETYFAMNRKRGVLYDGETRLHRPDGAPVWMQMMGGLAERAVVPATDVFPIPEHLPLEESCILGCAMMTAYGALWHAAGLVRGETLAVVGVGGVGTSLLQLARHLGASEVIAVDVREEKLEEARALGATQTVNAARQDPVEAVRELTRGTGVDVALEALGRPATVLQAFSMTRDGGRTVVVGVAPAGAAAPIELARLVRRGIRLAGSFGCRVRADMPEIVRLASQGKIDLKRAVSRRYPLEKTQEAYDALERGEILGRAIVVL